MVADINAGAMSNEHGFLSIFSHSMPQSKSKATSSLCPTPLFVSLSYSSLRFFGGTLKMARSKITCPIPLLESL